ILLEKMPIVLWSTDPQLNLTSSSGALSYLFARPEVQAAPSPSSPQAMPDTDLLRRLNPDSLPVTAQRRAAAGEAVSYEWSSGQRHFHVHVEPLRNESGDAITGTFGMAWDITAQHQAEKLVRQS